MAKYQGGPRGMDDAYETFRTFTRRGPKGILLVVGGVLAAIVLFNSFTTIGAGERGVVFNILLEGVQDQVMGEGLHFKVPFVETIYVMDVRIQKSQTAVSASSRDLQVVSSAIALNYHVDRSNAATVFQNFRYEFESRLIDPAVQESVKAVTAQFTAEELITRRAEVSLQIKENLTERLLTHDIVVDEFSITELNFSEVFNTAIEAKQTAEQSALKAQRDLDRIKIEAEQTITAAKAEAESQRVQRETITESLLQLRAIEKWNGVLPQVTSGGTPFIDLKALR